MFCSIKLPKSPFFGIAPATILSDRIKSYEKIILNASIQRADNIVPILMTLRPISSL
jgi:hypothetical protein